MDAKEKLHSKLLLYGYCLCSESLLQVLVLNEEKSLRQGLMKPMLTPNSLCSWDNLLLFQPPPSDYWEFGHSPCCLQFRQWEEVNLEFRACWVINLLIERHPPSLITYFRATYYMDWDKHFCQTPAVCKASEKPHSWLSIIHVSTWMAR